MAAVTMTRREALEALTAPGQPFELVETQSHGRPCRMYKAAPLTLRELYESTRSDLPFLVYEGERLSFDETWRLASALGSALANDFGVRKGDRVAISMRNYPEWIVSFMAATSIGAIAVALNALWQSDELGYALDNCEPRVILVDQERLDRLAACGPRPGLTVIGVRLQGALPEGVRAFADLVAARAGEEMPAAELSPDDDVIMLYTSGSTGRSKGAVSSHRNVLSALLTWEFEAAASVMRGVVPAPDPNAPQPATLLAVPLFHVTGLHAVYLASYRGQRRVVSMYKWDPAKAAALIEAERITSFTAPAAMTGDLVKHAADNGIDLASLAVVGGGGAPRAPEQVRAIDRTFANARPNTGWGMTETNAIGASIGGLDYLDHPASSGQISPVLDARIVDEAGRTLGPNQRGELQVRGASIMRGYWRRPDANAETFVDGWLKTGDVAYVDEDGFVYIVDRIKDIVIRGGENIGCAAVEAALLEHPGVLEASVYGVPDERLGEELAATLYCSSAVSEAGLREFLASRLARFEIPRYFHFEDAPLPRIASGKILKRQLRDEAVQRLKAATVGT